MNITRGGRGQAGIGERSGGVITKGAVFTAPHPTTVVVAIVTALITTLVTVLPVLVTPLAGQGRATEVIGDDERDMFVGTGSLILPASIPRPGREGAAECPGCAWRATLACDPVSPTACRGEARLCRDDHFWLRIWLRRPGGEWQAIGSDCFGPGGPATRIEVEATLRDRLAQAVPPLQPSRRPSGGILPHLPVSFDTGQPPGPRQWTWNLVGMDVTVVAVPRWSWQFAPNETVIVTTGPVLHTYRNSGSRQALVQATWSATYSVSGLSGLPVADPVRQSTGVPVEVGEARAVLIR